MQKCERTHLGAARLVNYAAFRDVLIGSDFGETGTDETGGPVLETAFAKRPAHLVNYSRKWTVIDSCQWWNCEPIRLIIMLLVLFYFCLFLYAQFSPCEYIAHYKKRRIRNHSLLYRSFMIKKILNNILTVILTFFLYWQTDVLSKYIDRYRVPLKENS